MPRTGKRVSTILKVVAFVQALDGFLVVGGCVCAHRMRLVGLLTSGIMALAVTGFLLLAFWAARRPRRAAVAGLALQAGVAAALSLPNIVPPAPALYVQGAAAILVTAALVVSRLRADQKR